MEKVGRWKQLKIGHYKKNKLVIDRSNRKR